MCIRDSHHALVLVPDIDHTVQLFVAGAQRKARQQPIPVRGQRGQRGVNLRAVSYTHLDVYKRQAQHREPLSQRIILHAGREQRLYELCSQLLLGALCRNAGKHPRCIYALLDVYKRQV